jgi:hypothetical protein
MPRRLLCITSAAAVALTLLIGLSPTPAQAVTSSGACPGSTLSQPFSRWGDSNSYALLAGGDFEGSLSGWTLSQGAQRATASEPFGATGTVGASSLALAPGASAQSPFTCVTASNPSFRFFARNEGPSATVLAYVVYKTSLGNVSVLAGSVALKNGWQPAPSMPTGAAVAGALSGNGTAQMALRFTALTGSSRIDDVFVDPRMR